MASKYDVLGVRAGLEYSWLREAIAGAVTTGVEGTTERHVFTYVNGDEPIRSIKDFVGYEPASGHAQEDCWTCPSYSMRDHACVALESEPVRPSDDTGGLW
jgi:hypothetical protein